jgi:8-oxo-dGTP pyrophosphatase MutT (NUDIX family)
MKRAKHIKLAFDKKPALAQIKGAGICICAADTGRVLFLKRAAGADHPETYDLPGGTAEDAELPAQTARRETREEIGVDIASDMAQISDTTMGDVNFITHYFEARCEFTPKLDTREHTEHVWAFPNDPPQPLHPGVALTLDEELAKDANPLSIAAVRLGHKGGKSTSPAKVTASRQNGALHGHDAEGEHWVTSKNDHHILLDGSGEVKAGAGGSLNGEKLSGAKSSKSGESDKGAKSAESDEFATYVPSEHAGRGMVLKGSKESSKTDNFDNESPSVESAVSKYQADRYGPINAMLRKGGEPSPHNKEATELVTQLDAAFKNKELSKATDVYRGFAYNSPMTKKIESMRVGESFTDEGFVSTSTDKGAANSFVDMYPTSRPVGTKGVIIKINAPAGAKAAKIPARRDENGNVDERSDENEILFDRGQTYTCTGVGSDGTKTFSVSMNASKPSGNDAFMAFDKSGGRSYDVDGRLKVETSNISRAMVCEYLGSEIPDAEILGLDPNKIYKLFRDPDELAKAASTFNNIQLLSEHVPVSTTDIQKDLIIGCTGTDTVFEFPFLKNSLCVWTKDGIDRVENKEAQEISCSYRYVADMTPGVFEGTEFHGSMRNIHGNHVILTPAGRCGPTVIVGDSALALPQQVVPPSRTNQPSTLEKNSMSKTLSKKALSVRGVLQAVLKPQFAADKMPDLDKILAGVDAKNLKTKKPLIVAAIKSHMAADADMSTLVELLDVLDGKEDADSDMGVDADPVEAILAHCRGKLSDDELAELESKVRALAPAAKAEDAPPAFKDEPKVGDKPAEDEDDKDDKEDKKDMVSKTAMDSAIQVAAKAAEDRTIARINGIHEARKVAEPIVGEIAVACDSAEDVYRAALKIRGVDVSTVHPSAFRTILELQAAPSKVEHVMAHDAASVSGMDKFLSDLGLPA